MGEYLSARECWSAWGDLQPESILVVGEWLEGGEEVLDERVVEAQIVVPLSREEQGQGRTPVGIVLTTQHDFHYYFLLPKLGDHQLNTVSL